MPPVKAAAKKKGARTRPVTIAIGGSPVDPGEVSPELAEAIEAMNEPSVDMVNHPPHYNQHPTGIEAVTITEAFNFNTGNAIKYIWRAGLKKDDLGIEDLEKASWYIEREIRRRREFGL